MIEELTFEYYGDTYPLAMYKGNYADGSLSISMFDRETGEPFATISKFLPFNMDVLDKEKEFYGDVNNCHDLLDAMTEAKMIKPSGKKAKSGYVTYESYRLIE